MPLTHSVGRTTVKLDQAGIATNPGAEALIPALDPRSWQGLSRLALALARRVGMCIVPPLRGIARETLLAGSI